SLRRTAPRRPRASGRRLPAVAAAAAPAAAADHPVERLNSAPMQLDALREEASVCTRCALSQGRTQVVFGNGHPDADLMFVGAAAGVHEGQQGTPLVGEAGNTL